MNKEQVEFLLKYAKIGVLVSKDALDEIEFEELKQEYLNIKKELLESEQTNNPVGKQPSNQHKPGEKKQGAMARYFGGIRGRQEKYKEAHKEDIV